VQQVLEADAVKTDEHALQVHHVLEGLPPAHRPLTRPYGLQVAQPHHLHRHRTTYALQASMSAAHTTQPGAAGLVAIARQQEAVGYPLRPS
jgi:hypothetical protein